MHCRTARLYFKHFGFAAVLFALTAGKQALSQEVIPPAPAYAAAVRELEGFIERQRAAKGIPAISIALVEDQKIIWAKGFGQADPAARVPATAETIYRAGSVSKLFTDVAVMQLVEQGRLDLDAPVSKYLPDFKPINQHKTPITLRQLMAHHSGLTREPPVGHYFDPTNPTLEASVRSLNDTELVYPPETRIKYSNAGVAVVGLVLQQTQKVPFARYLTQKILVPMGMSSSSFETDSDVGKRVAKGLMWTYHGRVFDAPTFRLATEPAGNLYTNVLDLARFMNMLFADGRSKGRSILKKETLEQMWVPQFTARNQPSGFGLGFHLGNLDGMRLLGHDGAVYGFATEFKALPDQKLGAIVIASKDFANTMTNRIATLALRHILAARDGRALPPILESAPVDAALARSLVGRYQRPDGRGMEVTERAGRLHALPLHGGLRTELRAIGRELIVDDCHDFGTILSQQFQQLSVGNAVLKRTASTLPRPAVKELAGLIGEYGWDHDVLYILERDGVLFALIEWFFFYPLTQISGDVYQFPPAGLYDGEKVIFKRDGTGRATEVNAANVVFKRRTVGGEDGATFRIQPQKPIELLRRESETASPPRQPADLRKPDLVNLAGLDSTLKLEIRYAGTNNFLGTPFYRTARAYLQRPAAEALLKVHQRLAGKGYGLLVYDAYRPWSVTKMFWEATPPEHRIFVADPAKGSRHNRGCAVDLTLYDLKTGRAVEMVGGYDEFSDRSYPDYPGGTSLARWHRDLLKWSMEEEDFTVFENEWWHFDYKDWEKYPISNLPLEQIENSRR